MLPPQFHGTRGFYAMARDSIPCLAVRELPAFSAMPLGSISFRTQHTARTLQNDTDFEKTRP